MQYSTYALMLSRHILHHLLTRRVRVNCLTGVGGGGVGGVVGFILDFASFWSTSCWHSSIVAQIHSSNVITLQKAVECPALP